MKSKADNYGEFKIVCIGHTGFVRLTFENAWTGKAFLMTMVDKWVKILEVSMTSSIA